MKLRLSLRSGLPIATVLTVFPLLPLACAPDSELPTNGTFTTSSSSSASSSGAGGSGGQLFFETGPSCADPSDTDGDFVADSLEIGPSPDTDGDGKPDTNDTDSDGDGIPDAQEAANPLLMPNEPGQMRDDPCDALADTDGDGRPDLRDLDSDNDGVGDQQESTYDPDGTKHCRVLIDCDDDGIIDLIEVAAGSSPTDPASQPDDPGLYFVLPYGAGEQTKDFSFSTGVAKADIYFLIDTTNSMQPAIDALKNSLNTKIIPTILNGDLSASPPIPAISDAWIGVGEVRDVPWSPYGQAGDELYRHRFNINNQMVTGDVSPPVLSGQSYKAPVNVEKILGTLAAGGGGDAPEATMQALWIASTNQQYAATVGGIWNPQTPYDCTDPAAFGVPCFRSKSLPIFVLVTDAAFHNGPQLINNYDPQKVGGTRSYNEAVSVMKSIAAKIVGVPVAGGNPGAARADLSDLAKQTGSLYHDPSFGGKDYPLVPNVDVASGEVSNEVVRLLGLLAGAGLHDVTTSRVNYDCAGGEDCTGDGTLDIEYHNPTIPPSLEPFDASKLITQIATVPSQNNPLPYGSLDETTFYAVRGDAQVTFRVHAQNNLIKPPTLLVMRALIRVETPSGQILGGKNGIKLVYFVIPQYIDQAN